MEVNKTTNKRLREESYLDRIRVFKCSRPNKTTSNVDEDHDHHDHDRVDDYEAVFLFKAHDTVHSGKPGTSSESVVQRQSYGVPQAVTGVFLRGLYDEVDDMRRLRLSERLVKKALSMSMAVQSKAVARDVSDFLRSSFRFDDNELSGSRGFLWVFVATVCRVVATKEYINGRKKQDTHCVNVVDEDYDDDDQEDEDDDDDDGVVLGVGDEDDDGDVASDEVKCLLGKLKMLRDGFELEEVKPGFEVRKLELMVRPEGVVEERERERGCSICLRPLAEKAKRRRRSRVLSWVAEPHSWDVVRLKCGHVFHHSCIFNWLPKKQSCPYCRTSSLTYV